MNWHSRDEEFRADYERDHRKHDSLPHRLDRQLSTAMDIAILARAVGSVTDAAALIEQYAQMVAAGARLDETIQAADILNTALEPPAARKEPA